MRVLFYDTSDDETGEDARLIGFVETTPEGVAVASNEELNQFIHSLYVTDQSAQVVTPADGDRFVGALLPAFSRSSYLAVQLDGSSLIA